jgi:hypothetical protein
MGEYSYGSIFNMEGFHSFSCVHGAFASEHFEECAAFFKVHDDALDSAILREISS